MKTFQDFSPYNAQCNVNQTVQVPKDSFSANCSKGFKRFQAMNKGLGGDFRFSLCLRTRLTN